MRILIPVFSPPTGTWGGMTRIFAVIEAAQKAGHEVACCAGQAFTSILEKRNIRVYPIPETRVFGLPDSLAAQVLKRNQTANIPIRPGRDFGNIWFVLVFSGISKYGILAEILLAEQKAVNDFKADMIFTDLDPAAYLLAYMTGLPISAAFQSPMKQGVGSLSWKMMNASVRKILKKAGLPPLRVEELFQGSRVLKIIPSIPELEDTEVSGADVIYVGHMLGDIKKTGEFKPQPGKRYVFVYMGTGAVTLGRLREVLPQVFPSGSRYICLVGDHNIQKSEKIENVEFHPFIPAEDILPYCDWTFCHGGQNTIIQSLIHGIPLLVFPGPIFERRYNARKIYDNEAGRMGELPDFNVAWIQSQMARHDEYVKNAVSLGDRIRSLGGAPLAIKAMEKWQAKTD